MKTGASCVTCPAVAHAAMPCVHTIDSRLNCPDCTICVNCCTEKGPVCWPFTATKYVAGIGGGGGVFMLFCCCWFGLNCV